MGDVHVTTTTGADTVLKDAVVAELRGSLRGELLCPSGAGTSTIGINGTCKGYELYEYVCAS
jgi:hypothetical protein